MVATRWTSLARWQTDHVASLLGGDIEPLILDTTGDQRLDVPISSLGTMAWIEEVQDAVLSGRADFAVHSAKDLPAVQTPGLVIGATPKRADPRDALVGRALADLPTGALVATGSVRRRSQLATLRPDLTFTRLRGTIEQRIATSERVDAVIIAVAALQRLGKGELISHIFDPREMLPQVAQGALAVECRVDDHAMRARLAAIDHPATRTAVTAERSFLAALGVGTSCGLPIAGHAVLVDDEIELTGLVASLDGRVAVRTTERGPDPVHLGRRVAELLLADERSEPLLEAAKGADVVP